MGGSSGSAPNSAGLKPAEFDEREAWKIRALVAFLCVSEAWSLVFGSGVLWIQGIRYWVGLGSAAVIPALIMGLQIEQWLEIVSGTPILNENDEIASGPTLWPVAYVLPPFIAAIGSFAVPLGNSYVAAIACVLSLIVFGWLMLRIRRIWSGRRSACG